MKSSTSTITVQNKKYDYTLKPVSSDTGAIHFMCKAAKIDQNFLAEDIPALIFDLPELIIAERNFEAGQSETLRFRISSEDKKIIETKALASGFNSVSDYLRSRALA